MLVVRFAKYLRSQTHLWILKPLLEPSQYHLR
jgi:hypothetical protein